MSMQCALAYPIRTVDAEMKQFIALIYAKIREQGQPSSPVAVARCSARL